MIEMSALISLTTIISSEFLQKAKNKYSLYKFPEKRRVRVKMEAKGTLESKRYNAIFDRDDVYVATISYEIRTNIFEYEVDV